jgi:hypothetical protein
MTARKILEGEAPSTITDETLYTEALLLADNNASDLAKSFTAFALFVKAVVDAQSNCWHNEVVAQAMVDQQNYFLDQETILFERALRRAIEDAGENNVLSSLRYKSYFKEEARRIRDRGLESQVVIMKAWLPLLRAEPEAQLQEWAKTFEARFSNAEVVLQARREAQAKTRTQRIQELMPLFDKANALRQETHGELSKRAAQKNLGLGWPGAFFRTQERKEPLILGELRHSLFEVALVKNLTLNEEQQKKVEATAEKEPLIRWLIKAATAISADEIFA